MQEDYYLDKLYPLQDTVLSLLNKSNSAFYLTGGTALSRGYFHHRYSDDLDFFVNNDDCFKEHVELIWKILEDDPTLKSETITATDSFVRVSIVKDDVILKLDFVNDINYHIGDIHSSDLFHKIDSLENILTNKISALPRSEAKDIVDIYFIVKHYNFDWKEIIWKAKKRMGGLIH